MRYTQGAVALVVNEKDLSHDTTVEELVQRVGAPSRTENTRGNEVSYFYDDAGMVFFANDGRVAGVGFNFNWDGDDRFPSKAFTGTLVIGELTLSTSTTREAIAAIQQVTFTCPAPILCASADRNAPIKVTIAFQDNKLTQAVFIL